ncbi:MAG: FAD-linked oxidase C-terminal domain-containing protein [Chloroflexota bacterium]
MSITRRDAKQDEGHEGILNNAGSMNAEFHVALAEVVEGEVKFDRFSRAMHATDASVYQILPTAVLTPKSAKDVKTAVRLCQQHGVSITARGGGTSQAGQAIGAGLSLDFSRHMNRLLELDIAEKSAVVEPGIVLAELNAQLKPHGLQLPLDISTANRATVGGMIANNSAGTRSVIYGKMIDYVESLDVVLSDGSLVTMNAIDEAMLAVKMAQTSLEGVAYRAVWQLARDRAEEIERRYPKILRRVGGYNLDAFVDPPQSPLGGGRPISQGGFNLCNMLVGSEGTLGLTVKAKVRLVELPKERVVCVVQFADVLEAMRATPVILEHQPSAVELVDKFILDTTRGRIEFEPLRDFIVGDPGAVLLVEFLGETIAELAACIDRLEADLAERGLGHHVHRAIEPAAQARIWELRKAALGLTMSVKGTDAKGISFVEDTAVSPHNLPGYIENFQKILAKYDTQAGFYAHASVGLLHIRPAIDMKTAVGVERFAAIAEEVADLVLEYGGAISGEHGDGLVRAPFQKKMFGPVLYDVFCQIKAAFDPHNLFNPGKIVHAPMLTTNLRYGADYQTPQFNTAFDFSDFGGLLRATEQCSGVGACRKTLSGTMCPSYMATRNEIDSTRGRANALRLALSGRLDSAGMTDHELKPVMDLCLECKACKSECPTGVDMARLKSEFQHQYRQAHGTPLRERVLSRMELISRWGSRIAPLSNWLLKRTAVRWLNEKLLGIDRKRPLPTFARRPFHVRRVATRHTQSSSTVALFADTFNSFYEPQHLMAATEIIAAMNTNVVAAPRVCCGRPLISKGFLDEAAHQAAATTEALLPLIEQGLPILFCEPSCYSAVVDDHPKLLRGEAQAKAQQVADACLLFEEWVAAQPLPTLAPSPLKKVLVHGHCHQKALVGNEPLLKMLSAIPDCEVVALDSGCCGMAGMFGYEQYDLSQKIGERRLLTAVRALNENETIVTSGFSCRQQIKHFTGVEAHSPTSLLASQIGPILDTSSN